MRIIVRKCKKVSVCLSEKKSFTGKLKLSKSVLFFDAEKHAGNNKFSQLPNGWESLLVIVNCSLEVHSLYLFREQQNSTSDKRNYYLTKISQSSCSIFFSISSTVNESLSSCCRD